MKGIILAGGSGTRLHPLVIVAPERSGDFLNLLGSGRQFGARITYEVQDNPEGLAQAFLIGSDFI